MPKTDILKLIFHHDQRLDDLAPSEETVDENPLTTFTNPDPTYSTLYFSGSDLENEKFGINVLSKFDDLLDAIEQGFEGVPFISKNGKQVSFKKAIKELEMNEALVITNDEIEPDIIHSFTRKMLRDVQKKDGLSFIKEKQKTVSIYTCSARRIFTPISFIYFRIFYQMHFGFSRLMGNDFHQKNSFILNNIP